MNNPLPLHSKKKQNKSYETNYRKKRLGNV